MIPFKSLTTALFVALLTVLPGQAQLASPPPGAMMAEVVSGPPRDEYGGLLRIPCSNKTGHFILAKLNQRWWFCTPKGHGFISMNVGGLMPASKGTMDCDRRDVRDLLLRKYGDVTFSWGAQALRRLTAWGFNSIGQDAAAVVAPTFTCRNCPSWPQGRPPIQLPYIMEERPISYSLVNIGNYGDGYMKDVMNGVNSNYKRWRATVPDVFDPVLARWWSNDLRNNRSLENVRDNSPWLLGIYTDDSDFFWGSGAGPDFTAGGHNNPNLAWMVLITSPTQTYQPSTQYAHKKILYGDTKVHSKADATNPAAPCSILNPCSLRDYLWQKYKGDIAALNRAWGSNYSSFDSSGTQVSGETIGMGDGSTTVFKHQLAHAPVSVNSVLIFLGNKPEAGDCAWFNPNCQQGSVSRLAGRLLGSGAGTHTSSLASPSGSINQGASSLNYSKGMVTISFVNAPAKGVAITANYVYGGWMAGGTGLMDEDGTHTGWLGTNPWCLEGPNPAYREYFSCTGARGGAYNPLPNANPILGADLDAWVSQMSARYFKSMRDGLRAVSRIPYLGLDTIGSWYTPSYSRFLQGAGPYIDAAQVQLRSDLPDNAAFQAAYRYTTQYLGDVPLINFLTPVAQSDSAMSCHPNDGYGMSPNQASRGQAWFDTVSYLLEHPGYNGTFPFVSFDWWAWQDFQNSNQGLVSIHDNAYDGKEAVRATGKDPWGYPTGGEATDYGDALSAVRRANALWYTLPGETGTHRQ